MGWLGTVFRFGCGTRASGPPGPVRVSDAAVLLEIRSEAGGSDSLQAELVVDGVRMPAFDEGPLDLVQLDESLRGDGRYFIWTCECGVPGCAGLVNGVEVRHDGEFVAWHNHDGGATYRFRRDELRRSLDEVLHAARRLLAERAGLEWTPDQNRRLTDPPWPPPT